MTLTRTFAAALGAVLTVVAVLGFFGNPIVGDATGNPLLVTGIVHDLVHLTTGALLLYIAFGMGGRPQADALIGVGIAYLVLVPLTLLSPTLLGIFNYPVNGLDHLFHLAVAAACIGVGWLGRSAAVPQKV
jgi:hypothetical protein